MLCASHLQLQEVNESVMGSSQLLHSGFALSLWSAELPTLLQGFSVRVVLGRGCAAPGMASQLHPHCKALCGHVSSCKSPCLSQGPFHRLWWALEPVDSVGVCSSLQTLTQQLVLQPSMCLLAAGGPVHQLYVAQSFLNENDFQRTFCGQNVNFTMSQHSPKPEKQRWFLLGGEGGSCCHSLSYAHTRRHTHTVALLSLPSHFPPPKDFEHFMEMLFSPQTVAFLLRSHQAACLLAFPGLRSQRGQLQPSHKCNVSDVPVVTMLSLWQVKVLGWPCRAARVQAAP